MFNSECTLRNRIKVDQDGDGINDIGGRCIAGLLKNFGKRSGLL